MYNLFKNLEYALNKYNDRNYGWSRSGNEIQDEVYVVYVLIASGNNF